MIKKLILRYKLYRNGYKWIKVDKDIINEYRYTTKKNRDLDNHIIHLKLIRSVYSGHIDFLRDDEVMIVSYGYLKIKVDLKKNKIIEIHNSVTENKNGYIDFKIKDKITKIYESVYGGEI
jgi:hypothetical protein